MSNLKTGLMSAALCLVMVAAIRTTLADAPADASATLADQVRDSENAFAKTMADRDFAAFGTFVADEAIFFGGKGATRGKAAVLASWKPLYEGASAPFSWKSETVEVLASGTLAHSSGPVFDPQGNRVGTFNSIWRREKGGRWRVVFDKGCDVCNCKAGS